MTPTNRALRREIIELASAALSDALDSDQQIRLNALLGESEAARRIYLHAMHDAQTLRAWADRAPPAAIAQQPTATARPRIARFLAGSLDYQQHPARFAVLIFALTGWFWVWFFTLFGSGMQPDEVAEAPAPVAAAPQVAARLTSVHNAVWDDAAHARSPHDALLRGAWLKLASGSIEVAFADGARTRIEGPAVLRIESSNACALERGRLAAQVSAQAHGFTVQTPQARIVDLGTRFGLHVDADGNSEVHVVEGAVRLESPPSQPESLAPQTLRAGQARIIHRAAGSKLARIEAANYSPERFQFPTAADAVAYWRFEEPLARAGVAGDALERHAAQLHGPAASTENVFAPTLPRSDRPNRGALALPGRETAYLHVPHHPALNLADDGFTIEAWVRLDGRLGLHTRQHLVHKKRIDGVADEYTEYAFVVAGGGYSTKSLFGKHADASGRELVLLLGAPGQSKDGLARIVSHLEVTPGRWHYISVSFDPLADQVRFVLDDQVELLHVPLSAIYKSDGPLIIGGHFSSEAQNRHPFHGAIDELRISRGALPIEDLLRVPSDRDSSADAPAEP